MVEVSFGAPTNTNVSIVAGQTMGDAAMKVDVDVDVVDMESIVFVECNNNQTNEIIVDKEQELWGDMCVLLCHNVSFVGDVVSGVWFVVEHNNSLSSNTHIAQLLEQQREGTQVWHNASDMSVVVDGDTLVVRDLIINVTIIPQSSSSSSFSFFSSSLLCKSEREHSTSTSNNKDTSGAKVVIEIGGNVNADETSKQHIMQTIHDSLLCCQCVCGAS